MPAFDPNAAAAAKQHAELLGAAEEHLGTLLAELYAAMPSLEACGFRHSFVQKSQATVLMRQIATRLDNTNRGRDAIAAAVGAMAPSMGVDAQALHALVTKARNALAQIGA